MSIEVCDQPSVQSESRWRWYEVGWWDDFCFVDRRGMETRDLSVKRAIGPHAFGGRDEVLGMTRSLFQAPEGKLMRTSRFARLDSGFYRGMRP